MKDIFLKHWRRVEFEGHAIYVNPEAPDWFVPNELGDRLLRDLNRGTNVGPEERLFLDRIAAMESRVIPYEGRDRGQETGKLKEIWLHLTNRCNMACNHCMFFSSPDSQRELSVDDTLPVIGEALGAGVELFYFTGGEPFIAESFYPALEEIFSREHTHAVVLTNLTLIRREAEKLAGFPKDRLHFQVSIDGMGEIHDKLRGSGTFNTLNGNIDFLVESGFPCTLAMTVTNENIGQMTALVDYASEKRVSNIHFMWLFKQGPESEGLFVPPGEIFPHLTAAAERAEQKGVKIDNIEILRSQVFSCPGTRYDLSNAGWRSLAVGPEGNIYPSPALIFNDAMKAGHISDGLTEVWKNGESLTGIRRASLVQDETYNTNIFKYIIGGGDMDHSIIHSGSPVGGDPYVELYNNIVQWLIVRESGHGTVESYPALRLRMGEVLGECPVETGDFFFTHSNCVLSLPGHDVHSLVNAFYTGAAETPGEEILNPVCYPENLMAHIPEDLRFRNYGCGSPVVEAELHTGETVVDLGSGRGIECFIAARKVGPAGKVYGIDMGDRMLELANRANETIARRLGYKNVEFKKAFLEELPLEGNGVDVVISNCVINLSPNKRRVFSEIMRVLKPGGRLVISDVTYEEDIPLEIKYNEKLRGECLGGALRYGHLMGLLEDMGFASIVLLKGYHYRKAGDFDFYSITYEAFKPSCCVKPRPIEWPSFKDALKKVKATPDCACCAKPAGAPQACD